MIDEKTLDAVVALYGHMCPGLAVGIRGAEAAPREIGPHTADEEVVCAVETDMCAVDAIQYMTGCTFGKGNLIYRDYGKNAFTFWRRSDGRAGARTQQGANPHLNRLRRLRRVHHGDADSHFPKQTTLPPCFERVTAGRACRASKVRPGDEHLLVSAAGVHRRLSNGAPTPRPQPADANSRCAGAERIWQLSNHLDPSPWRLTARIRSGCLTQVDGPWLTGQGDRRGTLVSRRCGTAPAAYSTTAPWPSFRPWRRRSAGL